VTSIIFQPTDNDKGIRNKLLVGFGDKIYYYITDNYEENVDMISGIAIISGNAIETSRNLRMMGNFQTIIFLPTLPNIFLFTTKKFSEIEPILMTKYEEPFYIKNCSVQMPFKPDLENLYSQINTHFWSIERSDTILSPVDSSGNFNLLKNIILDCESDLNVNNTEKQILLNLIELGWPEEDIIEWDKHRIIDNQQKFLKQMGIEDDHLFRNSFKKGIRKIIFGQEIQLKSERRAAIRILRYDITPVRPNKKLKVLDAFFVSKPVQNYLDERDITKKQPKISLFIKKIYVSFIRMIHPDGEDSIKSIIRTEIEKTGWKIEDIKRVGKNSHRFQISFNSENINLFQDINFVVSEFYNTLKEIYLNFGLNRYYSEHFFSSSNAWIKGIEITVISYSNESPEFLKRSLSKHFGQYIYPHRGPERDIIPHQKVLKEEKIGDVTLINLSLYFSRPFDFLFKIREEIPFELDEKSRQAIDYCYLGKFVEATNLLKEGRLSLTADKYVLKGGITNINMGVEIYKRLEFDNVKKNLEGPLYFIDSSLSDIERLLIINKKLSDSINLFCQYNNEIQDAFLIRDKTERDYKIKKAELLRRRCYLPYPTDISAMMSIVNSLFLNVRKDVGDENGTAL
jgi:hypothetical protein